MLELEEKEENNFNIYHDGKSVGTLKCKNGQMLCYAIPKKKAHITTQNLHDARIFFLNNQKTR